MRAGNTDASDDDLVAGIRGGDDRAFEQLYERYHRRVAAYVKGMVRDHGRAEDITQEVFLSALRRMRETERPIAFKPWVYEIAKNACIDHFRRSRRGEEVSYHAGEGEPGGEYGRALACRRTPDVAVDDKLAIDTLRGAFGELSDTHHEILVMRELEGLSYRQIGERLGMSRPAVESTLFRARRRLAEEYQELVSGERCLRVQGIIDKTGRAGPGLRDRRRLAVHVSHCQPCRRHAHAAGLDVAAVRAHRPVRARAAALLPLPAFLRRRVDADVPAVGTGGGGGVSSSLTGWLAQSSSALDPTAAAGWLKAAAAAGAVAVVGMGAGHSQARPDLQPRLHGDASGRTVDASRRAAPPQATGQGAVAAGVSGAAAARVASAFVAGMTRAGLAPAPPSDPRETSNATGSEAPRPAADGTDGTATAEPARELSGAAGSATGSIPPAPGTGTAPLLTVPVDASPSAPSRGPVVAPPATATATSASSPAKGPAAQASAPQSAPALPAPDPHPAAAGSAAAATGAAAAAQQAVSAAAGAASGAAAGATGGVPLPRSADAAPAADSLVPGAAAIVAGHQPS